MINPIFLSSFKETQQYILNFSFGENVYPIQWKKRSLYISNESY